MSNINAPAPHIVAFEVTRKCRFNCVHCRASAGAGVADELSTEQCKAILRSVAGLSKCILILTGGEPMERADIYELTSYGNALGLKMVMATCGYALDTEAVEKLQSCGLKMFSFSLDGATAQTHDKFRKVDGAFDIAIKAAKLAADNGMKFQINTTITRSNISQVEAIAKLATELGASCFNPFILVPTGRGTAIEHELLDSGQYEKLLAKLLAMKLDLEIGMRLTCGPQFVRVVQQADLNEQKPGGCLGGRGFGFISYRGDVQTCGFMDISAGNLVENNFDLGDIWNNSKFLNTIRDAASLKGKCGRCEFAQSCRGCRARALASTGDYMACDPICGYIPKAGQ